MRIVFKMAVLLGAVALLAGQTVGQEKERPGRGAFGNAAGLVMNPSVQKELKLSDEQIDKAKKAAQEVFGKFRDDFTKLKDSTPEERAEVMHKVSDEAYKQLGDVLKSEQIKRLRQIELQQVGLSSPTAQKALKLSDEQKDKVKKIAEETREKGRDLSKDFKTDPKGTLEKMSTLRKEGSEKQLGVLTDDQKKQWKEMTGEPFEVKFEPRAK